MFGSILINRDDWHEQIIAYTDVTDARHFTSSQPGSVEYQSLVSRRPYGNNPKALTHSHAKTNQPEESGLIGFQSQPMIGKILLNRISARDKNNVERYLKIESGCVFELQ